MNPTEQDPQIEQPPVSEPDDFKAMLIGAALIFVIAFIPYASLLGVCCLPQISGALLAIHLFTKEYRLTLTFGQAIKLGIFTCLLGGMASVLVAIGIKLLFGYQVGQEIQDLMLKIFNGMGPQWQQAADKMKEAFDQQKAQGFSMMMLLTQAGGAAVYLCIAGLIGGALGAALFKRGPKAE